MPENVSDMDRAKMDFAQTRAQERDVTKDPKINPAGKGKFYSSFAPQTGKSEINTYAKPDPAARARGAGAARKRAARNSWEARAKGQ